MGITIWKAKIIARYCCIGTQLCVCFFDADEEIIVT